MKDEISDFKHIRQKTNDSSNFEKEKTDSIENESNVFL